jgi:hypothetical protein
VIIKEEHRPKVSENSVLRGFVQKRDEMSLERASLRRTS